tara:strand:- start:693 stop:1103 length:411 start_codon:yes stop_codon:yes gene_type:complete
MIKMSTLMAIVSTAVIAASTTIASAQSLQGYSSTIHPATNSASNSLLHPPTDITIINASTDYIYALVPGSPVNDLLRPMSNDHIYSYDPNLRYNHIVLQDAYRNSFYDYMVCRLAIITVHGYAGNYTITTDDDLCN